jgi:hypothetical protein
MAAHGLVGHRPRRRRGLTKADSATPPAPDLVGRLFDPDQPDVAWCGDITYIPTDQGWLYLASVIDLASRHLLGWSMDKCHDAGLVVGALDAAAAARGRHRMDGTIFHTDRGGEYTSAACIDVCERLGLRRSMGRTGSCLDNAVAESFLPPSRSSWSTAATTAPAPRRTPRSSAGSPGTTSVGFTPPTATYRRWSGNSSTVMSTRYRQPWPHSHGARPAGGGPLGPARRPAGAAGHGRSGRLAPPGWPALHNWGPAGPRRGGRGGCRLRRAASTWPSSMGMAVARSRRRPLAGTGLDWRHHAAAGL